MGTKRILPLSLPPVQLILPYLLVLLVTGLTTLTLHLLRSAINPSIVALLFLLPVALSTVLWGIGPGVIAALIGFLSFNYFFIEPYYTFFVHQTQDLLGLVVFLGIAVVISQLVGRTNQSLDAATAREHEAIRLYELSRELAGLQDDEAIVNTLANRTMETFQAERVEVLVEGQPGRRPIHLSLGESSGIGSLLNKRDTKPSLLVPLQTVRGLLGEIRVWRVGFPVTPEEERLLRTFASQGVLALERARLGQAETRARVLEESDRLKSSLLSSVSHELRSPLATIKAAVTSLRSETVPWESEARGELLAAVEEETDHLNQLVGNLLNMSRIEAGALNLEREWNVLSEITAGVVSKMQPSIRQRRIQVDIPEEIPLVPVDYVLMEQVFTNLISNSVKYSPPGSTIRIRARESGGKVILVQVNNQGPPVPEEHLDRIFDKFYRVTAADRVTGTGLGLSICKGIIEAHGGRIWAENQADGFSFKFTIPLAWEGMPQEARLPKEPLE